MHKANILLLLLVLLGAIASGCISSDSASTNTQELDGGATTTLAVKSADINGTFSGWVTVPASVFEDVLALFRDMNATLYAFTVKVVGRDLNASIVVSALKLVPPFVPKDFNVTVNGRPIIGTVCVPYAERIPVLIEVPQENFNTTSYLSVRPQKVLSIEGMWDTERLDELNGSTIMRNGDMELKVMVRAPGDYIFTVLCNGTEVSSGGLEVSE